MTFKEWLNQNTSGELLVHAKRRCFPGSNDFRQYKQYFNTKYKRKYIPEIVIEQFENAWNDYFIQ